MGEDVRKAVDAVPQSYIEGLKRGDVAAVLALYTEDAIQLPPNIDILRGRQKIREMVEAAVQWGFEENVLTGRELVVSGDVAYEIGHYHEKFRPKGREPFELKGKYLLVFKRTTDGWKINREIWNNDKR